MTPRFTDHDEFDLGYQGGKKWRVTDGFTYWVNDWEFVTIPTGFITDFASIPRPLKVLWESPGGLWDLPAVVHDFLYQYAYVQRIDSSIREVTRAEADQILRDAMGVQGVRASAAWCIYRGVRLGGWKPWRNYRRIEDGDTVEKAG